MYKIVRAKAAISGCPYWPEMHIGSYDYLTTVLSAVAPGYRWMFHIEPVEE